MGYHRAGFDVVGVDIKRQPNYPFPMVIADATEPPLDLAAFDAIHASPPCQDHMRTAGHQRPGNGWMLAATRRNLESLAVPWVIENVPGAPMRVDFKLCGCMFGLEISYGQLVRERWFETSWRGFDLRAPCLHTKPGISVVGEGTPTWIRRRLGGRCVPVADLRILMGIEWTNRLELSQAIPPAYTEYIGRHLLAEIGAKT